MRMNKLKLASFLLLLLILLSSCKNTKTEYWPNGSLKSEIQMKNKLYHGHAIFWYDNGNKELECYYENNVLQGPKIRYYPSGQKKEEFYYNAGKLDGLSVTWYTDGGKSSECAFINGLMNGPYHEYYPDGAIMVDGHYLGGKFTGKWFYYDSSQKIVGIGNFDHGAGIQRSLYASGNVRKEVHIKDNVKDGEEIDYDVAGKITSIKIFSKGVLKENLKK